MSRTLTQYFNCNPKVMKNMSPAAIQFCFEDMQHDIKLMAKLLGMAAYPRRGTSEENMTMAEFAKIVQEVIPHKEAVENL